MVSIENIFESCVIRLRIQRSTGAQPFEYKTGTGLSDAKTGLSATSTGSSMLCLFPAHEQSCVYNVMRSLIRYFSIRQGGFVNTFPHENEQSEQPQHIICSDDD